MERFLPEYPTIDDEEFYKHILEKKEFWINHQEQFFHQMNIARYMSQWTLYDSLFLYHEMGTGKSGVAVKMTDLVRTDSPYKKVLYITHNPTLVNNYKDQIARLSPRMRLLLSGDVSARKKTDIFGNEGYHFFTLQLFYKEILNRTDEWIKNNYEYSVIIIDEAHHLVQSNENEDRKCYDSIMRVLSLIKYRKLLVMTGTPIREKINEIVPLINLVLPLNKQLPVRNKFLETFFEIESAIPVMGEKHKINLYRWKHGMEKEFKELIKGRVSYIRRKTSDVNTEYEGMVYPPMKSIPITVHQMQPNGFQNNAYRYVFKSEKPKEEEDEEDEEEEEEEGLMITKKDKTQKKLPYKKSEQVSLFAFPEIGEEEEDEEEEEEMEEIEEENMDELVEYKPPSIRKWQDEYVDISNKRFRLKKDFVNSMFEGQNINFLNQEEKLQVINEYSATYAATIKEIIGSPNELSYVYCNLVNTSGILLLVALMKTLFGYEIITSVENAKKEIGRRMLLLNDCCVNENEFQPLIEYFNNPANKNGDYCQVVLGTNKTKEGISLMNVRQIHILTPSWNMGDMSQAMARSLRQNSHKDLQNPKVRIFLHATIPFIPQTKEECTWEENQRPIHEKELMYSVDFTKYFRSEIKERNAKLIERTCLEASWDCAMNIPVNMATGRLIDGSRECEYSVCKYTCDGQTNIDTYGKDSANMTMFYSNTYLDIVLDIIRFVFKSNSVVDIDTIMDLVQQDFDRNIVENCLQHIMYTPIIIYNNRGISKFLSYSHGLYFLIDNPYLPYSERTMYLYYYSQFPSINIKFPMYDVLDGFYYRECRRLLSKLVNLIYQKSPKAKEFFQCFPLQIRSEFCEISIKYEVLGYKIPFPAIEWFDSEFNKKEITYIKNNYIEHRFVENEKTTSRRFNLKQEKSDWKTIVNMKTKTKK